MNNHQPTLTPWRASYTRTNAVAARPSEAVRELATYLQDRTGVRTTWWRGTSQAATHLELPHMPPGVVALVSSSCCDLTIPPHIRVDFLAALEHDGRRHLLGERDVVLVPWCHDDPRTTVADLAERAPVHMSLLASTLGAPLGGFGQHGARHLVGEQRGAVQLERNAHVMR